MLGKSGSVTGRLAHVKEDVTAVQEPCGSPPNSKGLPRTDGRTGATWKGAGEPFPRPGKRVLMPPSLSATPCTRQNSSVLQTRMALVPALTTAVALIWLFSSDLSAVSLPGAQDRHRVTEGDSTDVRRYRSFLPLRGNLDEAPIWKDSRGRDLQDMLLHLHAG